MRKETEAWRSREGLWLGQCQPGQRLVQGSERQGMGCCLAESGEMEWVWLTKDLEIFGLKRFFFFFYLSKKFFTT